MVQIGHFDLSIDQTWPKRVIFAREIGGFSNTTWGSTNKDVNMIVLRRSMGVSPVNTFFSMNMVVEPRKIGI